MIPLWLLQLDRHPPVLLSSLKLFTSKTKSHNLRLDYEHRSLSNAYKGLNLGATLSSISNGPHAGHPRSKWWLTMSPLSHPLPFSISLSLSLPMAHSCNTFERRVSVNWHVATSFSQIPQLACFGDPKLSLSCLKIISKLSQSCPKVVLKLFQGPSQALEEGRQVWGWWGGRGRLVDRTRVTGG